LLTGAAAHAADRDPASEGHLGSSLIGAVVDGDHAAPAVSKILKAAAQPLESDRPAHQHHVTSSVLTTPARVLTRPAEVLTETLDEGTKNKDAVNRVVRDLTGPLRLTGGPADSRQLASVAAPLTTALSPVTDLLPYGQRPATAPEPADTPDRADKPAKTPAALDGPAMMPAVPDAAATAPATGDAAAARTADTAPAHHVGTYGSVGKRHSMVTDRHRTAATAGVPDRVRESSPGGDGPAPLQVHLGALSGSSTSGSGSPAEGGSSAVLPAAVGCGPVADHRLPRAADAGARCHDAEAPTVSPD